jgi:hypothetical protein
MTPPLDNLQQRIAQQEAQLESLRSLQAQLAELTRRKDELLAQVQEIDIAIHALSRGEAAPARVRPTGRKAPPQSKSDQSGTLADKVPSTAELIVQILREAGGGPLPVRDITREFRRRGFQTSSTNFRKVIETRTIEMVKKGLLTRAPNRAGLVLPAPPKRRTKRKSGPAA